MKRPPPAARPPDTAVESRSRAETSAYRRKPDGKSLHGRIVRELGLHIVSGALLPGERLPSEAQLFETYEVSRPVLREAVRVLAAKGLVISKQRSGAIVQPRSEWHLLDPDVLFWLIHSQPKRAFVDTLMVVRRIIEPAAAALAAKVATDDQLAAIAEAYAGMEAACTPEELLEPDVAFHRRVAEASNNELLAYIGNMLSLAGASMFLPFLPLLAKQTTLLLGCRPATALWVSSLAVTAVAFALPYSPLAGVFGFVPLPLPILAGIVAIVLAYTLASELGKSWFFARAGLTK